MLILTQFVPSCLSPISRRTRKGMHLNTRICGTQQGAKPVTSSSALQLVSPPPCIYLTSTTRHLPTISLSASPPSPPQPSLAPGSHPSFRPPPSPIGSSSTPPSPHVHPPTRTIPNPAHRRVRTLYSALLHRRSAPSYTLFGIR